MRATLLVALVAAGLPARADDAQEERRPPRKRIGVLGFADHTQGMWFGRKTGLADTAADATTMALSGSSAFLVVHRDQLRDVVGEAALQQGGPPNPQLVAKAARAFGLQAVVTGTVTDFAMPKPRDEGERTARGRISLRVTDASTGEVWLAESGEGISRESEVVDWGGTAGDEGQLAKRALYNAVVPLVRKAAAKARTKVWEGVIAKIAPDKKVYVTGGSEIGIAVGAQLTVRKQGAPIHDPMGGQVIGHEPGKAVATLRVMGHLNERVSTCSASSGSGFAQGDKVYLDAGASAEAPPPPKPVAKPVKVDAPPPPPKAPPPPPPKKVPPGKCAEGKYITAATSGHCCWPEQVWSDVTKGCIGAPRCPSGMKRDGLECVPGR